MKEAEKGTCRVPACVPNSRILQVSEQVQGPSLWPLTRLQTPTPGVSISSYGKQDNTSPCLGGLW